MRWLEVAGALALAFAWVLAGPVLLVILFGLPAEAAADAWRRRRERRRCDG